MDYEVLPDLFWPSMLCRPRRDKRPRLIYCSTRDRDVQNLVILKAPFDRRGDPLNIIRRHAPYRFSNFAPRDWHVGVRECEVEGHAFYTYAYGEFPLDVNPSPFREETWIDVLAAGVKRTLGMRVQLGVRDLVTSAPLPVHSPFGAPPSAATARGDRGSVTSATALPRGGGVAAEGRVTRTPTVMRAACTAANLPSILHTILAAGR